MKISVKRGTKEIGGSAVEIIADCGQRIIVDLGLPLNAENNIEELLPDIKGIKQKSSDLAGLLISHAHQDHYGLGKHIDKSIPVYLSKETASIMRIAKQHHLPDAFEFENKICFENEQSFSVGVFTVTPYLCDHSAYGAYAFLIEADGQKVFYSGDFRAHGRKRKLFYNFMHHKPENTDVLLLEGSCLGREKSEHYQSEEELEKEFIDFWKNSKGLSLVQTSAQNIDRMVTIYRAARRSRKILVLSGYAGHILWATDNKNLPNFTWKDVKKIISNPRRSYEIDLTTILQNPRKYVVVTDYRILQSLQTADAIDEQTSYVYSMWNGYKEKYQDWLGYLKNKKVQMRDIHTSGHADIPTLKKMVDALKPKMVVPIHTFYPERFCDLFNNAVCLNDGDVFDVSVK